MKTLLTFTILTLTALGCAKKQTLKDETSNGTETQKKTEIIFQQVADFPLIKDTTEFILNLRQKCGLETDLNIEAKDGIITTFKKIKLFGSNREFYFLEYNWGIEGCMASFPWKKQLLLTTEGKLVKILSGQRFDFVTIFPNQNPFLLLVSASARGNGGHEIYRISSDTIQNVYDGYFEYEVQTYDSEQNLSVFEPNELNIAFNDENEDGYNDIIFTGQKLMLGKYTKDSLWYDVENGKPFTIKNPARIISIKYIFLYDKQTGHFKAKENYGLVD